MPIALAVSLLCSVIYTATISAGPFSGRWAVKAMAVAALALLVRKQRLPAAALLLGALGDALLEAGSSYFVHGLAAFLCGHIVYTIAFLRAGVRRLPAGAPVLLTLYAAAFAFWLWPHLGPLQAPVLVYMAAITVMATCSLRLSALAAAGAVLFLLSDSLLAANQFVAPVAAGGYLIWITYYAAQLCIALAFGFHRK